MVILNTADLLLPLPGSAPSGLDYQDTLHLRPAGYAKLQAALVPLLDKSLEPRRLAPLNSNNPAGR